MEYYIQATFLDSSNYDYVVEKIGNLLPSLSWEFGLEGNTMKGIIYCEEDAGLVTDADLAQVEATIKSVHVWNYLSREVKSSL